MLYVWIPHIVDYSLLLIIAYFSRLSCNVPYCKTNEHELYLLYMLLYTNYIRQDETQRVRRGKKPFLYAKEIQTVDYLIILL